MTKMLKTCIGVGALLFAALTASAQAYQCNNGLCDPGAIGCDTGCAKSVSKWYYGGHLEVGIYGNNHGQRNKYDGYSKVGGWNSWSGNTKLLGPARMADFQMNQLYGIIGKKLDTRCGWDVGGRIDFMYGTDASFTQSNGMEYFYSPNDPDRDRDRWGKGDYLASLPQAYGEVGYRNVSLKLGKFYTPFGHESIMSTGRFFYSTSYAFGALPVSQTGAVANWDASSRLSVYGGWVNGENSTFANADDNAALFGFNYKVSRKVNFGYGALLGKNDTSDKDYFVHSFIIGYKPNRCWDYTFQWVLRNENYSYPNGDYHSAAYGINQELIYKLNRCWAFGLRGEWMYESGYDANSYELTLGTNWTPNKHLLVRPEIRYDYCDYDYGAFGSFKGKDSKDQFGIGISTVVKF